MTDEEMLAWAQKPENASKQMAKLVLQKLAGKIKPQPDATPAEQDLSRVPDPEGALAMNQLQTVQGQQHPRLTAIQNDVLLRGAGGLLGGGPMAQGALNTAAGAASRAINPDPNQKAFALRPMAQDFAAGALPTHLLREAGKYARSAPMQAGARGMSTPEYLGRQAPLNATTNADIAAINAGGRLGGAPGANAAGLNASKGAVLDLDVANNLANQPGGAAYIANQAGGNPGKFGLSQAEQQAMYNPSDTLVPAAAVRSEQLSQFQPKTTLAGQVADYMKHIAGPKGQAASYVQAGASKASANNDSLLRYLSAASEAQKRGMPVAPEMVQAIRTIPGQQMAPEALNTLRAGAETLLNNPDDPNQRGPR